MGIHKFFSLPLNCWVGMHVSDVTEINVLKNPTLYVQRLCKCFIQNKFKLKAQINLYAFEIMKVIHMGSQTFKNQFQIQNSNVIFKSETCISKSISN